MEQHRLFSARRIDPTRIAPAARRRSVTWRLQIVLALALLAASVQWAFAAEATPAWVDGEVLIKFKSNASPSQVSSILADLGATRIRQFRRIHASQERISGVSVATAIGRYRTHPAVEFIEPNYVVQAYATPNDPLFPELWGLQNTGQTGGTPGADIRATLAWDVTTGSSDVLVAIIDTGLDYGHPDLAANVYVNPGEIAGNGIDDDGNGFVDDVHGWDFINRDSDPMDDNGHGTHVAGTIGAIGDNGVGVAGVNWHVRIMPLKFLGAGGSGSTADAVSAVEYATMMGARIMSNSWGGGGYSEALRLAIQDASDAGILFVAAAGNAGMNTDFTPTYPAGYDVPNVISVAATDHNDALAGFSNYGAVSVDLAAPGVDILSTTRGGSYVTLSGTSMATPHVSGVLALMMARYPGITAAAAKAKLLSSVDVLPSLTGRVASNGRLNAFLALAEPDSTPPEPVADLTVAELLSDRMGLRWTSPSDAGSTGRAARYEVYYATFPFDASTLGTATLASGAPDPLPAGSEQQMEVAGLAFNTDYWFAVRSTDPFGNPSLLSNVVSARTLGAPQASLSPASFSEALLTGAQSSPVLALSNTGQGNLDFQIQVQYTTSSAAASAFVDVPKGQPDPRVGDPVVAGSGGPDRFGYRWADSNDPGGPAFNWVEISGTGTRLPLSGDDQNLGPFPIGFEFPFYGSRFTQFRASTNGFLSFTSSEAPYTNQPLPNSGAPENLLAAFWDDLYFQSSSAAYYRFDGSRLIVEYSNVWHYAGYGPYTFEIILDPTGTIVYQYLSMLGATNGATVGIQDGTRTDGLNVAFNAPYLSNNLAIRIKSTPLWLTVTPDHGRVLAPGTASVRLNIDAGGLAGGGYDAQVHIASNDPAAPEQLVPVHLDVTGAPDIATTRDSVDFGQVYVGVASSATVQLINRGTDRLDIDLIGASPGEFTVSPTSATLAPGGLANLSLAFRPTAVGPFAGTLTLHSNDPDEAEFRIALAGVGVAPPEITVSPAGLTANLLTGVTETQTLTVGNTGGSDLAFSVTMRPAPPPNGGAAATPPALAATTTPWSEFVAAGQAAGGAPSASGEPASTSIPLPVVVTDPSGDGGPVDLTVLRGMSGNDSVQVQLELSTVISPANFGGFVSLDVDQDRSTGRAPSFGSAGQDIGAEYEFQLFSLAAGYVALYNAITGDLVGLIPATVGATTVRFSAPLSALGGDDGNMDVTGVVGNAAGPTDWFPDAGHGTILGLPWLTVRPSSGIVPAGGSVDLSARFDPGRLSTGAYDGEIVISSNDPAAPERTVPVRLGVTGAPVIAFSPASFDFDSVYVGSAALDSLAVSNAGTETLHVASIASDQPDFTATPGAFDLAPDERTWVIVRFAPSTPSRITGTLTITHDAAGSPTRVPVAGDGLLPPDVDVSPTSLSAALLTNGTDTRTLDVRNTGGSDLHFRIAVGRQVATADFTPGPDPRFTPGSQTSGAAPSAPSGPTPNTTAPTTNPPAVQAIYSGTHLSFGVSQRGEIMPFQYPLGTEHLQVGSFLSGYTLAYQAGGVDHIAYAVYGSLAGIAPVSYREIVNTPAEVEVEVVARTSDGLVQITRTIEFRRTDKALRVETVLEAATSAPVDDVVFKEGADWDADGIFEDTWDYDRDRNMIFASRTHFVAIAAHEVPDLMDLWGWDDYYQRATTIQYPAGPIPNLDGYEILHFSLGTIAPGHARFISAAYGAGDDLAELRGVMDRTVSPVQWLTVSPASGSIPAGGSLPLQVTFDATGLNGGAYEADILVTSDDPDESEVHVPASLSVTGVPVITVSPNALDFGNVFLGRSSTRTLMISNIGSDLLDVTSVSSSDGAYTVDRSAFSLAPGASTALQITFVPTRSGGAPATLAIVHNAGGSPTEVPLTGTGTPPPVVTVEPGSIRSDLESNQQGSQTLTIGNAGGSDLTFSLLPGFRADSVTVHEAETVPKGLPDPRVGDPVTEGQGGPDRFGYRWVDSGSPGGPVYDWVEIADVGTVVPVFGDDVTSSPVPIGFAFPYYGFSFTSLRVCSNGFLSFNSSSASFGNVRLPSPGAPPNLLSPFWTDLYVSPSSAAVFQYYDGTRFIVEWNGVSHLGAGGSYTFEVILYPTGTILFQYKTLVGSVAMVTVGIQDGTQTDGLTTVFNAPYLHASQAIRFNAAPSWLSVDPEFGTVPAGESLPVQVITDATNLFPGDYNGTVEVGSNDPVTPTRSVPVFLHVIGIPRLVLSRTSLDFGTHWIGEAAYDSVRVTNTGSDVLAVTGIEPSTADYTVSPASLNLAPLQSTMVRVRFLSDTAGRRDGTLRFVSNDPGGARFVGLRAQALVPPDVDVQPASIEAAAPSGGIKTKTLVVRNTGGSPLTFAMRPGEPLGTAVPTGSYAEVGKGEFDTREGIQGRGGPDAFGYSWTDSDEPGGPSYEWVEIADVGTPIPFGVTDDANLGPFPIGFEFLFYDMPFSTFRACSNGWISFTNATTTFSNQPLPNAGAGVPENLLAALWDDLIFTGESRAWYRYDGTRLIVEYKNVIPAGVFTPTKHNFEILLYPNGTIWYQYQTLAVLYPGITVGFQNDARNDGLTVSFNNAYLHPGLAVRIDPPVRWIRAEPRAGIVAAGESANVTITLDAATLPDGDHRAELLVASNDPDEGSVPCEFLFHVGSVDAAAADIDPNTLNSDSRGRTITAYAELPPELDPNRVLLESVRLNGSVPVAQAALQLGDFNSNGVPDLQFKFDRMAVEAILPEGESVPLAVTGEVRDIRWFTARDVIRVIRPRLTSPNGGESFPAGSIVNVSWANPPGWNVTAADLFYSLDAGRTWDRIAGGVTGTSALWTLPAAHTDSAAVRVYVSDADGPLGFDSSDGLFRITGSIAGVTTESASSLPAEYAFPQNEPNPFNPVTRLRYDLPRGSRVHLRVYDAQGRLVRTLVDRWEPAGRYRVTWDGRDAKGSDAASGVYYARLTADRYGAVHRMLLLK